MIKMKKFPEYKFKFAILDVIKTLGGMAKLKSVYSEIKKKNTAYEIDTDEMYQVPSKPDDVRPRFTHDIRENISVLAKKGFIKQIGRAEYSLTEKGKSELEELKKYRILRNEIENLKKK